MEGTAVAEAQAQALVALVTDAAVSWGPGVGGRRAGLLAWVLADLVRRLYQVFGVLVVVGGGWGGSVTVAAAAAAAAAGVWWLGWRRLLAVGVAAVVAAVVAAATAGAGGGVAEGLTSPEHLCQVSGHAL